MTNLKRYAIAILKVYWPLILMFICNDAFAINAGDDEMDTLANNARKWVNGYVVTAISLLAFSIGGYYSATQHSATPIGLGGGIAAAVPLGWTYFGGGKTLLLGF